MVPPYLPMDSQLSPGLKVSPSVITIRLPLLWFPFVIVLSHGHLPQTSYGTLHIGSPVKSYS
jgi:hypothetical protein